MSDQIFNHLLVIDDNEAIHDDFRKIFLSDYANESLDELHSEIFGTSFDNKAGNVKYELSFASQGKAGYELLKTAMSAGRSFGVAFVDMRMPPGWDGIETIENLWKVDPDLQVVICTAFSDHSWDEIIGRLGQTDQLLILKKPFDQIEVVQLAASLTKKRQLLAESKARMQQLEQVVVDQGAELTYVHKDAEYLISSISSALVSLDETGSVSRWNPMAEKIFGVTTSEAVGFKFEDLPIRWSNFEPVSNALHDCSVVEHKQEEFQIVDDTGATKTLHAMVSPILNDPTSKARLILATDVTIQKAMQIQLDQTQRLESVGQLAAGVAHEINTPMQYIGDNVRYVAKSMDKLSPLLKCLSALVDPEVTDEQLNEIRRRLPETVQLKKVKSTLEQIPDALADSIQGVEAVSKIVAAMKEFSHPGSDEKSQVCLNHILESTMTVAKNEWKLVADIETEFEADLVAIDALPTELNQAFLNIIVNASHAIGDRVSAGELSKGLIKIKTMSNDDFLTVTIKDNGGGIPAAIQDRVFEPFFTTKEVGKGTGQGLAIVFNIITRKHNGTMTFEVEEGVGSTFKIELPRQATGSKPDVSEAIQAGAEMELAR